MWSWRGATHFRQPVAVGLRAQLTFYEKMRKIKLFIWFAQIRLPFWQTFPLHLLRNKNCLQIRWVPSVVCRASNFFAHFEQAARQCKGRKDCFLRKEELGEELVGASDSSSEIFSPDWRVSPRFQVDSYDWFVCFQTFCTSLAQWSTNSQAQTEQILKKKTCEELDLNLIWGTRVILDFHISYGS